MYSTSRDSSSIHAYLSMQINDIYTSFSNHNTHHYAMHAHVLFLVSESRSSNSLRSINSGMTVSVTRASTLVLHMEYRSINSRLTVSVARVSTLVLHMFHP
jgi:hypothetical protein